MSSICLWHNRRSLMRMKKCQHFLLKHENILNKVGKWNQFANFVETVFQESYDKHGL